MSPQKHKDKEKMEIKTKIFTGIIGEEYLGLLAFKPEGNPEELIFVRVNDLTDQQKMILHGKKGQPCSFGYGMQLLERKIVKIKGDITL